jgi:hypothetical protein
MHISVPHSSRVRAHVYHAHTHGETSFLMNFGIIFPFTPRSLVWSVLVFSSYIFLAYIMCAI